MKKKKRKSRYLIEKRRIDHIHVARKEAKRIESHFLVFFIKEILLFFLPLIIISTQPYIGNEQHNASFPLAHRQFFSFQ